MNLPLFFFGHLAYCSSSLDWAGAPPQHRLFLVIVAALPLRGRLSGSAPPNRHLAEETRAHALLSLLLAPNAWPPHAPPRRRSTRSLPLHRELHIHGCPLRLRLARPEPSWQHAARRGSPAARAGCRCLLAAGGLAPAAGHLRPPRHRGARPTARLAGIPGITAAHGRIGTRSVIGSSSTAPSSTPLNARAPARFR